MRDIMAVGSGDVLYPNEYKRNSSVSDQFFLERSVPATMSIRRAVYGTENYKRCGCDLSQLSQTRLDKARQSSFAYNQVEHVAPHTITPTRQSSLPVWMCFAPDKTQTITSHFQNMATQDPLCFQVSLEGLQTSSTCPRLSGTDDVQFSRLRAQRFIAAIRQQDAKEGSHRGQWMLRHRRSLGAKEH